jgi:hypothetical protein
MHRFHHILITAAMVAASLALTFDAKAQPQGGAGRGGRGFGGGPGGGFGGGLLNTVQNPAVQTELKLKEAQKAQIQTLVETVDQRRQQLRNQFAPQGQQQNQRGGRNRNNANANVPGGQNGGGGNGGGGFGGGNGGGGFAGGQNGGFGGQNGGFGRGGRGQQDPQAAQRFAAMGAAMNEIQQGSEQALAKILERGQFGRLKQIQLQLDGLRALTRPDMIEKLTLGEDQVEQIQQLLREGQQAQRENGRPWGDMMKTAFPNPNAGNNGQNGGGQNGNGGGRGGRGGFPNMRDPAVREAMNNFMEKPEVKAKLEEMRTGNEKIQSQLAMAVNRALGKRQAAAYKKMLGAPFDLSQVRGGGPGQGPWNRLNRNGNQADATKTAAKAQSSDSGDEEGAATAKPAAKSSTATAKPKRKSLRELRGLDQ